MTWYSNESPRLDLYALNPYPEYSEFLPYPESSVFPGLDLGSLNTYPEEVPRLDFNPSSAELIMNIIRDNKVAERERSIEISNLLRNKIKHIEGPTEANVMVSTEKLQNELGRNGPVLLLLSDHHFGNQKCTSCDSRKGCFSLYNKSSLLNYFNKLALDQSIVTDVFLETWLEEYYRQSDEPYPYQHGDANSALIDVLEYTKLCLGRRMNCPLKNVRTHMSDPRKRIKDNLFHDLPSMINTETTDEKNYLLTLMIEMCTSITIDYFFTHQFFRGTKAYKQFNKLPELVQINIRQNAMNIRYNFNVFPKDFSEMSNTIFTKISNNDRLTHYDQKYLKLITEDYIFLPIYLFMVDLYTICRILKLDNPPSQLSICYLGVDHIRNIRTLMATYYEDKFNYNRISEKCVSQEPKLIYRRNMLKTRTKKDGKVSRKKISYQYRHSLKKNPTYSTIRKYKK